MLISIVVVSYNQERFIIQTLESILNQETKYGRGNNIQLIVADDNSDDNTFQIEQLWIKRNKHLFYDVLVLPSDQHRGINLNFARALRGVNGKYWMGVAGDDMLADIDLISILSDSDVDICICSYFLFRDNKLEQKGENNNWKSYCFWNESVETIKKYSDIRFLFGGAGIVYKNCISEGNYSLLSFISQFNYMEDYLIWDYSIQKENLTLRYLNYPIYIYRKSEQSITNEKDLGGFHVKYINDACNYRLLKMKRVNSFFKKYSLMIEAFQIRFSLLRFLKYLNVYKYIVFVKSLSKTNEMKKLAKEVDDSAFNCNVSFVKKLERDYTDVMQRLFKG